MDGERKRGERAPHWEFGARLEVLRRKANVPLESLPESIGVVDRTIRRHLAGDTLPNEEMTTRWEQALGQKPGSLRAARGRELASGSVVGDGTKDDERDHESLAATPSDIETHDRKPAQRYAPVVAALVIAVVAGVLIFVVKSGDDETGIDASTTSSADISPVAQEAIAAGALLAGGVQERSGGQLDTWPDPTVPGRNPGPPVSNQQVVTVKCRVRAYEVPDGNRWWYLLDSEPWSSHYFATADGFFNRGRGGGQDLVGTRFFDPKVPVCAG